MAGNFGVIGGSGGAVFHSRVPSCPRTVQVLARTRCGVACEDSETTAFDGRLSRIRRWLGEGDNGADDVRAGSDVPTRRPRGVRPVAGCSRRGVGGGGRTGRVGGGPRPGRRPAGPCRVGGGRLPARTSQRLTRRRVSPGGSAVSASAPSTAGAVAAPAVSSLAPGAR